MLSNKDNIIYHLVPDVKIWDKNNNKCHDMFPIVRILVFIYWEVLVNKML